MKATGTQLRDKLLAGLSWEQTFFSIGYLEMSVITLTVLRLPLGWSQLGEIIFFPLNFVEDLVLREKTANG